MFVRGLWVFLKIFLVIFYAWFTCFWFRLVGEHETCRKIPRVCPAKRYYWDRTTKAQKKFAVKLITYTVFSITCAL